MNRRTESPPGVATERPFDALYDRAVAELLDVPVDETWVETRAGPTHVLLAGDAGDPPVLVLQGGNVTNPVTLAWVQELAGEYRLVAPDTPGEPGKRARPTEGRPRGTERGAKRPARSTAAAPERYGPWVGETLDALGLERVAAVGVSHGAGVLLEAASEAPERFPAAVLVVPAGFGTPLSPALARVVLPALAYRLYPREWLLRRALAPMFTEPVESVEEVTLETVGLALRTGDLDSGFPGPDGPGALVGFDAPTLVLVGGEDPFFPGERTAARAEAWLPGPTESVLLEGERHFLSPRGQRTVTALARSFLSAHYASGGT